MTLSEFCQDFWHQKTEVPGISCGVLCMRLFSHFDTIPVSCPKDTVSGMGAAVLMVMFNVVNSSFTIPLPSNRLHHSYDVYLEVKREDYQNCSVLYCEQQLCTMIHTYVSSSYSCICKFSCRFCTVFGFVSLGLCFIFYVAYFVFLPSVL